MSTMEQNNTTEFGVVDIVNAITDSNRAEAIDKIHDILYAKASDAMSLYKQSVAQTFFDEPTETETEDETDNGTD